MAIVNYVRNGRRFGDRKMLTGAKIPKMSSQAYDSSGPAGATAAATREPKHEKLSGRTGPHWTPYLRAALPVWTLGNSCSYECTK